VRRRLGTAGLLAGLLLACAVQLIPFYVTLTTALKPRTDLSSQWLMPTRGIYWQNFQTAIVDGGILRAIGNSAIVTVASTVLICLLGALAAYPLARRPTLGNRLVLGGIVALIMIPPLSILVPVYTLMAQLDWINTYGGAVALMVASQLPLSIFLYTHFMRSLPLSVEEAATVDGAGTLQVLFRVVFPMLKPVTATVIILTSVTVWNEYALSVFVLRDPAVRTTAPAIGTFFASQGSNPNAAAAAALLTVIPVLVAYLVLQRSFIKGMVAGAEQ
jgi:raffinose/stachyose/melibiose transport system permease protein